MEKPIKDFVKIILAVSRLVGEQTGIDPLLSRSVYDYEVADPGWNWKEIQDASRKLRKELVSLPPARKEFIEDLLTAVEVRARESLGDRVSFFERVEAILQVSADPISEGEIATLRSSLQQKLLTGGFNQDLEDAYRLWIQSQIIPVEDLFKCGQEILAEVRKRANACVAEVPANHVIELNFPRNYPYNGYSDYSKGYRGRIVLNGDLEYTRPGLVHLICHEALPGHQLFSAVREKRYHEGLMPVEGTIDLANTPITPVVEGNCETGKLMLGLNVDLADEIYDLYNRYSSAVATNLAIACNADGMDKDTAVKKLMEGTFVTREKAERTHTFFTHPLWQNSFLHYWFGRDFMRRNFHLMIDDLSDYYRMIYEEPHTVRTLKKRIQRYLETKQKKTDKQI